MTARTQVATCGHTLLLVKYEILNTVVRGAPVVTCCLESFFAVMSTSLRKVVDVFESPHSWTGFGGDTQRVASAEQLGGVSLIR